MNGRRFSRPRFGEDRDFRSFDFEKPVKVGEEYDVEIKEVGSRGDGIARIKNFVVFVPNAKEGEKIKVKISEVRRRFAIAERVGEGAPKKKAEAVEEESVEEEAETVEESPEEETVEEEAEVKEPKEEAEVEEETEEEV